MEVREQSVGSACRPISRRQALRVGTLIAGTAWVTPVVEPFALSAAAADMTSSMPKGDTARSWNTSPSTGERGSGGADAAPRPGGQLAGSHGRGLPLEVSGKHSPGTLETTRTGEIRSESTVSASASGGVSSSGRSANDAAPRSGSAASVAKEARLHLTG